MRIEKSFSAVMLLAAVSVLGQSIQKVETVKITDVSRPNHIIQFSGNMEYRELANGDAAYKGTLSMRNVSGKPIVAMTASFKRLAFRGPEEPMLYNHDFFFKSTGFAPGATETWPQEGADSQSQNPPEPSFLKAELLFVQFADGTTWGGFDNWDTGNLGPTLLEQRKDAEAFLNKLLDIYNSQGEVAFVAEIKAQHKGNMSASSVARHLSMLYQQGGIGPAIEGVKTRLQTAADRKATGKF